MVSGCDCLSKGDLGPVAQAPQTQRCQLWTEDSSQTAANGPNAQNGTRAPKQKVCVDGVTLAVCVMLLLQCVVLMLMN